MWKPIRKGHQRKHEYWVVTIQLVKVISSEYFVNVTELSSKHRLNLDNTSVKDRESSPSASDKQRDMITIPQGEKDKGIFLMDTT